MAVELQCASYLGERLVNFPQLDIAGVRLVSLGTAESVFSCEGLDLTAVHLEAWGRIISLISVPADA